MLDTFFTSAQQYIGGSITSIGILIPILYILMLILDKGIDYLLRYVNEDSTPRSTVAHKVKSYFGMTDETVFKSAVNEWIEVIELALKKGISPSRFASWFIREYHGKYDFPNINLECLLVHHLTSSGSRNSGPITRLDDTLDALKALRSNPPTNIVSSLSVFYFGTVLVAAGMLIALGAAIYVLPLWLLVTLGTVYGTLRLARFSVRTAKKLTKHMSDGHGGKNEKPESKEG